MSNFELTPVVAVAGAPPVLSARVEEVEEIVAFPLSRLLTDDGLTEEDIVLPEVVLRTGRVPMGRPPRVGCHRADPVDAGIGAQGRNTDVS